MCGAQPKPIKGNQEMELIDVRGTTKNQQWLIKTVSVCHGETIRLMSGQLSLSLYGRCTISKLNHHHLNSKAEWTGLKQS